MARKPVHGSPDQTEVMFERYGRHGKEGGSHVTLEVARAHLAQELRVCGSAWSTRR
jgi:hypothetical protein